MINYFIYLIMLFGEDPIGKVTYIQETKLDGHAYSLFDGETELYFDNFESVYIHPESRPKSPSKFEDNGIPEVLPISGDKEGFPIYKYKGGFVYRTVVFARTNCIIHDTIPHIDWNIQPSETRQIGKYTCRKAVGLFGGRVYDAWFTPEIPVPHGPYKLGGLPGLILEAHSRDGKVSFHFKSFEWTDKSARAIEPPSEKIVLSSPSEFLKTLEQYTKKYEEYIRINIPDVGGDISIGSLPTDGDRYIEKGKIRK